MSLRPFSNPSRTKLFSMLSSASRAAWSPRTACSCSSPRRASILGPSGSQQAIRARPGSGRATRAVPLLHHGRSLASSRGTTNRPRFPMRATSAIAVRSAAAILQLSARPPAMGKNGRTGSLPFSREPWPTATGHMVDNWATNSTGQGSGGDRILNNITGIFMGKIGRRLSCRRLPCVVPGTKRVSLSGFALFQPLAT